MAITKTAKTLRLEQWQTNEKGWYIMDGETCIGILFKNKVNWNEEVQ
tara:strand:- start:762 stop:902 length:141 start_codon:yes stop_codon:yes gene_type:complete